MRANRRPSVRAGFLACLAIAAAAGVAPAVVRAQQPRAPGDTPRVQLRNVAAAAGVRFVHQATPSPDRYLIESVPGGLAVFDYNGDGRPDIFFTNAADPSTLEKRGAMQANRLFRNDGGMRFTDVTDAAGVRGVGYAMGAAAGDYDNDGDVDLFVAGVRQHQLLRNRGDGRFEDVTKTTGIAAGEWGVAAGWIDYDGDGRLDLFIVNYVKWSPETNPFCGDRARGIRIYCHPRMFTGLPNRLYRNRGDGTFEDVSARAGVLAHVGKGMSVAFADVDRDARLDMFVTNDAVPDFLFHNKGDGTFAEIALLAGVSVPDAGRPISSMGTDVQDYDNDGWEDIHLTALTGETFPLFRNETAPVGAAADAAPRPIAFADATQASGLARMTVPLSGWCAIVADFDNDGWKDVFTANGHVNDRIGEFEAVAFKQPNLLALNDSRGRFHDATAAAGLAGTAAAHRGCGVADFDGDGRLDLVVTALGGPAELWKNDGGDADDAEYRWLIVRLRGTRSNRDGIGARVTIAQPVNRPADRAGGQAAEQADAHANARVNAHASAQGGSRAAAASGVQAGVRAGTQPGVQVRTMTTAMGYASSSHAGLHFGVGRATTIDRIEVQWPSGTRQVLEHVKTNQVLEVREP